MITCKLGMPYMGSKRKLAPKIINHIIKENPNVKHIYDLFGGGGAISFYSIQHPQIKTVHYNELNKSIVLVLQDIIKNGVSDYYYKWISRDYFKKNVNKDTLKSGICKLIWSFGNNQKNYLFSKDIENDKRLLHEIIVNKCEKSINLINDKFSINLTNENPQSSLFSENINERRLRIMSEFKQLQRLQQLEQLERLQQLEQLEQLQQLEITNKSYKDVKIQTSQSKTIIYLDPPYFSTAEYKEKLCHDELYDYIRKSKYKVYLSSYESELTEVLSIKHRSTLSAKSNNEIIEKLFTNKIGRLK